MIATTDSFRFTAVLGAAFGVAGLAVADGGGNDGETKTVEAKAYVIAHSDDDKSETIEIRVVNEDVEVKVNGEKMSDDRYRLDDDVLIILNGKGEVLRKVHLSGPRPDHDGKRAQDDRARVILKELGDLGGVEWRALNVHEDEVIKFDGEHPRVMLGVVLAEPGEELMYHFGLKPGHATFLTDVYKGLPAARAGLARHDIVVEIEGSNNAGLGRLHEILGNREAGDRLNLCVIHKGKKKQVTVELDRFDPERLHQRAGRAGPGEFEFKWHAALKDEDFVFAPEMGRAVLRPEITDRLRHRVVERHEDTHEHARHHDGDELEQRLDELAKRLEELERMLDKLLDQLD